jgi:hypothetical protein
MPRLASRAPLSRSIRKAATLVVPRSTASPRLALPTGAKSISSWPWRRTRSAQFAVPPSRNAADSPRAAPMSISRSGMPSACSTRSASLRLSSSVAAGRFRSWLLTAASSGSASPASPRSTSARTTGASERGATSMVQSLRTRNWQARSHFLRPGAGASTPAASSSVSSRSGAAEWTWSMRPSTTRTTQVPQVPRPPQAPTMRRPLRRAPWKMVSSPCTSISRSSSGKCRRCGAGGADIVVQEDAAAAARSTTRHLSRVGHWSQRDHCTGGRSMPTPITIEQDLTGCIRPPLPR